MSEAEMRELDAWIFTNIFGYASHYIGETSDKHAIFERVWLPPDTLPTAPYDQIQERCETFIPRFTASPEALKLLKKCGEHFPGEIHIELVDGKWFVSYSYIEEGKYGACRVSSEKRSSCHAKTLELAICLFSKMLFAKLKPENGDTENGDTQQVKEMEEV
jgi:hypothetical protein